MKITIENLTKKFGATTAVNDLSVTMESGKMIALLGPSGCGKTTILNMLSGILPATSGKIWFDDKDVTDLPPEKRNIGLVFQNYALYPHMTVLENICFPLEIKKVPKKQRIERAKELAELVRISEYLNRKPAELSGGQQQRVAIARALAKNPKLLLCDEPTGALDYQTGKAILQLLQNMGRKNGMTVIIITHNSALTAMADRVIRVKNGTVSSVELNESPQNIAEIEW